MPLYEYQCDSCGTRVEKIQKFSDPPLDTCEPCGGKLRKLLSSPAIQFKGSGWYVTDYAKKTAVEGTSPGSKPSETPKSSGTKSDAAGGTSGNGPADAKS